MTKFIFEKIGLKGAYLITDFYSGDSRGGFTKFFEKQIFEEAGIDFFLNETFCSISQKNVIRGLHFQLNKPQAKIVSVISGAVWDVIVDLRMESITYKQWRAQILSADNHKSFYVPRGFAHGFASLEDNTVMLYQCEGEYDPKTDTGIRVDDNTLGIDWPIDINIAIRSKRDMNFGNLEEYALNPMKC